MESESWLYAESISSAILIVPVSSCSVTPRSWRSVIPGSAEALVSSWQGVYGRACLMVLWLHGKKGPKARCVANLALFNAERQRGKTEGDTGVKQVPVNGTSSAWFVLFSSFLRLLLCVLGSCCFLQNIMPLQSCHEKVVVSFRRPR